MSCSIVQLSIVHRALYTSTTFWSNPYTSMTALHTCMCILVCLLGPTTYHKFHMSALKYFIKDKCSQWHVFQCRHERDREWRQLKSNEFAAHVATYFLINLYLLWIWPSHDKAGCESQTRECTVWGLLQISGVRELQARPLIHDKNSSCYKLTVWMWNLAHPQVA